MSLENNSRFSIWERSTARLEYLIGFQPTIIQLEMGLLEREIVGYYRRVSPVINLASNVESTDAYRDTNEAFSLYQSSI